MQILLAIETLSPSWVKLGCWFSPRAPVAFWHVMNYDVQMIRWNADIRKCFSDTFDERTLLILSSSLPHLHDHYWQDITSSPFLNRRGLIFFQPSQNALVASKMQSLNCLRFLQVKAEYLALAARWVWFEVGGLSFLLTYAQLDLSF
jgi:hypothetical protein